MRLIDSPADRTPAKTAAEAQTAERLERWTPVLTLRCETTSAHGESSNTAADVALARSFIGCLQPGERFWISLARVADQRPGIRWDLGLTALSGMAGPRSEILCRGLRDAAELLAPRYRFVEAADENGIACHHHRVLPRVWAVPTSRRAAVGFAAVAASCPTPGAVLLAPVPKVADSVDRVLAVLARSARSAPARLIFERVVLTRQVLGRLAAAQNAARR